MIIDNMSIANVASTTLNRKLNLNAITYQKLYRL